MVIAHVRVMWTFSRTGLLFAEQSRRIDEALSLAADEVMNSNTAAKGQDVTVRSIEDI